MASFRDLPINRKLTVVIMVTSTFVLVLASAAFVINEYLNSRRELIDTVSTLSAITAENTSGAIAFNNAIDAQRVLQALQADPRILYAALYDQAGELFAAYGPESAAPAKLPLAGYHFQGGELLHVRGVYENRQLQGTLFVRASAGQIYAALRTYLMLTLGILAASFVVALLLAKVLRRRISEPLLALAETTRRVSQDNDYGLRAEKSGNDELGELAESFNRMMSRIQASDAELRRSQDRLRLALEAGHIGTWEWNPTSDAVHWDEYVFALLGCRAGEVQPSLATLLDRVIPEDRAVVQEGLQVLSHGERPGSMFFRVQWTDGSLRYLASRGALYTDPASGERRVTGVVIDITQTKRAEDEIRRLNEELEQRVAKRTEELALANKELESFTYSVSHDLRAPLRHVNGFAQMLEQEFAAELPEDARRLLTKIRYGARNMGQLVDDLLRLARVGRQALIFQTCSLSGVVQEILREIRPETEQRQIEWRVGELPVVSCDAGLIRQVFANLISNAVKYTRTRKSAVIEIGSRLTPAEYVCYVKDNGVGFEMKYAEKLFGVFQRLHRAEEFEGTGVGLAIAQRIIHKHGGRITVDAAPEMGACFTFTLPRHPGSPHSRAPMPI
jgi:PAS domain S-box-containing protein